MTIQEVLKSGRMFKRAIWDGWVSYNPVLNNGWFSRTDIMGEYGSTSIDLYYEDLVADDWEIDQGI